MRKTARGNLIDMNAIIRQNENTLAVSNSRMNARGDTLDRNNNVLVSAEQIARLQHKTTMPPEEIKMSQVDNITKTVTSKTPKIKKPTEINRTEKTDVSGNKIIEIEYDDGNIKIIKEDNDEDNYTN